MAMTMQGEVALAADRATVWAALNDAETLKSCIPGCQSLEKTSDTSFSAVAKLKIGPVSATFKGSVQFSEIDPPNGYRITGEGEGGIAGFAKGGALVKLTDHESGTLLIYEVEANVGPVCLCGWVGFARNAVSSEGSICLAAIVPACCSCVCAGG